MSPVIEINGMSCRFGELEAVRSLTLEVPAGCVYAFLGMNGAGKSTTIRALLNLVEPSSGSARLFGVESSRLGPRELARIGYVSENQSLPEYLTLRQLTEYCRSLYATWDDSLSTKLQRQFALPPDHALKHFSRGMKIKAALLVAVAHRPELLILDEPFSGLDVLTRDELIQGMLELAGQENWTVFLSSHDIGEVERFADWVGIMDGGRLRFSEPLEALQARFRRVDVTVEGAAVLPPSLPASCLQAQVAGSHARWIDSRYAGEAALAAEVKSGFPDNIAFAATPLSLREIFIALLRMPQLPTL